MRGNVGGDFKPLIEVSGKPLVRWVVDALRESESVGEVVVVAGHRSRELEEMFRNVAGVRVVFNQEYALGEMVSSVKVGVQALEVGLHGFLLAFADQPAVKSATIQMLVNTFAIQLLQEFLSCIPRCQHPLVLPVYGGRKGHPVVLSGELVPEILALGPQETLKAVVQRHIDRALLVPVDDPEILEDLDTPEDVARWRERLSRGV